MNIFAFYIRHTLDAFRDTNRIVRHFDLIKLNGISVIFKLFFIRFFYAFSFIRNLSKPKKIKSNTENVFFENSVNTLNCIKDIHKKGYSEKFQLKEEYKKNFLNYIFECKNLDLKKLDYSTNDILKKKNENLDDYFVRLKKMKISRVTGYFDLKKPSEFKNFLISKEILNIVQSYLNTRLVSINASFFISNPVEISDDIKYQNAQFFHWDNDFRKFVKLYIYLNDVDEHSGPHVFVEQTHKTKDKNHKLCRLYSDISIYEKYPQSNIIKFTGSSGSTFFVDSYGIHKGEVPTKKSRILLNIHFGVGKILYSQGDIYVKI